MKHPRVLRMSGIDPEEYSSTEFGIGLESITLMKYEIDVMRLLNENADNFLKQLYEEKKNEYIIKMDQSFSSGT